MRVRIHRGTQEIGGTCVELACDDARLLLDLGLPLDGDPADAACHPAVAGLSGDGDLLALVISHGHRDHLGLAHLAGPALPVAMGAATHRILTAAAPFVPDVHQPETVTYLVDGVPLTFGPFTVTPTLVDHSAYDAYALLVEAGGRRLFYSGDLRAHGRKGGLFERLVRQPPGDIDILLLEGTSLGRLAPEARFPTEAEVEATFVELFRTTPGMALVAASVQNIDRMVSLYRAAKRTGRTFVIDLYAAEILRATGNPNIPQSHWPGVAVFVPFHQRIRIKQSGRFDLLAPHRANRIFPEQLRALAPRAAYLFRPAMLRDLERAECLSGARVIWSQWDGYLRQERGQALLDELARRDIAMEQAHTSGHSSLPDLKRLAAALAPRVLVPIHTFEASRFPEHFGPAVALKADGQWWEIAA